MALFHLDPSQGVARIAVSHLRRAPLLSPVGGMSLQLAILEREIELHRVLR
jgi:hypothetical protein